MYKNIKLLQKSRRDFKQLTASENTIRGSVKVLTVISKGIQKYKNNKRM